MKSFMSCIQIKVRLVNIFCAAVLLSAIQGSGSAQPISSLTPQQTPTPAVSQFIQVYGIQGVLVETTDGRTVSAQSVDQAFNPASAVKLGTALVALQNFGPGHRFTTGFWTDGSFDKTNGQILGNLYVTGRDPSFHYEHAVMVARQLNSLGIRKVTGDLPRLGGPAKLYTTRSIRLLDRQKLRAPGHMSVPPWAIG